MPKLKTAQNVALYTIGEIIPRVLSFLLLPVLTKYLSTSDYGISSYINTVILFLYAFTTLSINSYALRTYYKVPTEAEKKKLIGNIFVFLSTWGFVMLILEALLLPLLLHAFAVQVPFYPFFLLGLIINFFDVTSVIPLITYRVHENAKGFVMLNVGRTILQYVLILLFVAWFKYGLLGSFLGRLFASIPFLVVYIIVIKKNGTFNVNVKQIKEGLKFSLPLLPGALSYLVISMFDRVILERYVSLSQLGIYAVASTLALTLNIVIQGLYRSFEQKIYREHSNSTYYSTVDTLYKIFIACLYIPAFCVILFSKEILLFFTSPQYFAANYYVIYLVIGVITSGINTFLGTLFIADGHRKIITYSSFVAAIISFFTNLIFIKYYGVIGACIASIISFLTVGIFYFFKIKMQKKYIYQQLLYVAFFFLSQWAIPQGSSIIIELLIKILLLIIFGFIIKTTLQIQLPAVPVLKPLKFLKAIQKSNKAS